MRKTSLSLLVVAVAASLAVAGGTVVKLDDLSSAAPSSWKSKPSPSKFRLNTFVLPKAEGDERDTEVQVIFFGKDSGGALTDNIKRWKTMFEAPEGKTLADVTKEEKYKVGKVDVTSLDIHGIYLDKFPPFDPNAKTIRRPDYRRINVYFDSENGPFFIIFVGPAKTVGQNKKAFDEWLKAFK